MSRLKENRKMIDVAVLANAIPRRNGNSTILPTGQRRDAIGKASLAGQANRKNSSYIILADQFGTLSESGKYYYSKVSASKPDKFDRTQATIKKNGNDYIMINGKQKLIRSLRADGTTQLSAIGKKWYRNRSLEIIVSIPVLISGTRADGFGYTRTSTLPVDVLGLSQIMVSSALSEQERIREVKKRVLASLLGKKHYVDSEGQQTLMQISSETIKLDKDGQWLISTLTTEIDDDGVATTQAKMRQPLGGCLRGCAAFIPFPEQVLPIAFEIHNDRLCVPRQIAVLLGQKFEVICESFDELMCGDAWRVIGISANNLRRWCVCHGHPFLFVNSHKLIDAYSPKVKHGRTIACCSYDSHAYIYKSARVFSSWQLQHDMDKCERTMFQQESVSTQPSIGDWKEWQGIIAQGSFWCDNLEHTRRQLLERGYNFKVILKGSTEIGSISMPVGRGSCVIKERIPDSNLIAEWISRLPQEVSWNGERLPALAQKVLFALLKSVRRSPSSEHKIEILETQDYRCDDCAVALDENDTEFDHKQTVRSTLRGSRQSFRALCSSCHAEKTRLESKTGHSLKSCFSKHVWDNYAANCRPPPLVTNLHEYGAGERVELDVKRCRMSALRHSAHDFPIFSVLDNIRQSAPGVLCDLTYISLRKGKRSALSVLPWVGSMWYSRVAAEHLLHYGIATWEDCKFSLQATSHAPANCLEEPLRIMENAWGKELNLAKFSINALIGLWASTSNVIYNVKTSNCCSDSSGSILTRLVEYGDGELTHDHLYATTLLQNTTMRVIHDQVMHTESSRMATMVYIIKRLGIPSRCLKDIKTDAIILEGFSRKHLPMIKAVTETKFSDLPNIRRRYEKADADQRFLNDNGVTLQGTQSNEAVFRFAGDANELKGNYRPIFRDCEPPSSIKGWEDLAHEVALEKIMRGEGIMITGSPGTGKTHELRSIVCRLREAGKIVHLIAKTHCSVQNLGCGCVTADSFVRKHARNLHCDVLVIEEMSQIDIQLWSYIALVRHKHIQTIVVGDMQQFSPICNCWCGTPVADNALESSDMLLEMCQGNRLTLTENRRSDQTLFNFYTSLKCGTTFARPLDDALVEAKSLFPKTNRRALYTLTMSHRRRVQINRRENMFLKPKGAIHLKAPLFFTRGANVPQSMYVWVGMTLIGSGHRCLKGVFVTVEDINCDSVTVSGQKLNHADAIRSLRLCSALTYASVQGLTLKGIVRIETDSRNFTLKHLYIGSSRATCSSLLEVI